MVRFGRFAATALLPVALSVSAYAATDWPPYPNRDRAVAHYGGQMNAGRDIVDTAVSAGSFKTLTSALTESGLVDTLKGDSPFTVFAPTDEAFAQLPEGTVENLLKPENKDQLVAILTYHVVPGEVMSWNLVGRKTEAVTAHGGELAIDATDGVNVNDAKVIVPDIKASNGVIHVIDRVLLPR